MLVSLPSLVGPIPYSSQNPEREESGEKKRLTTKLGSSDLLTVTW
jgi:hypothetical protein